VLHTTAGYLVYASITHQYVFDYHDGDIYGDGGCGWVTGHSYIVYGRLANAPPHHVEGFQLPPPRRLLGMIDKTGQYL